MPDLAPYAARPEGSRGRRFDEDAPQGRSEFQRDRDRIVHSTAFRRLEYKTQVFVNHEGDLYRTRLTHSIEVAQIGRSIARALHLNEDLTEAIALAHDLGHTPFGHAGQDALHACMRGSGGFEHNLQSLRVVDILETRYAAFDGLNLTFETREGILKHCSLANARKLGELGERFLRRRQPSLEAQIANVADEIAYNNHDVDDGLRSGLLCLDQLSDVPAFSRHLQSVQTLYPGLADRRLIHETVRRMINALITDLVSTSAHNIRQAKIRSLEDVQASRPLIRFSPDMAAEQQELKDFLRRNLYQHYLVARMANKSRRIVGDLFDAFKADPRMLPAQHRVAADGGPVERAIADYIAGMTDRYAIREHRRLFAVAEI
ncbi:MAG: deoxyguanosinetriphosphate triphosphohydrolase [Betaproteobacteria bacterium]|nr:MAG: deoxyguanosinetriphosphate triphosphohydrolase [Betaproteobacteria bacterium]